MTISIYKLLLSNLFEKKNYIIITRKEENSNYNSLKVDLLYYNKIIKLKPQWNKVTVFSELGYHELFIWIWCHIGSFLLTFFIVFIDPIATLFLLIIFALSTRILFKSVKIFIN